MYLNCISNPRFGMAALVLEGVDIRRQKGEKALGLDWKQGVESHVTERYLDPNNPPRRRTKRENGPVGPTLADFRKQHITGGAEQPLRIIIPYSNRFPSGATATFAELTGLLAKRYTQLLNRKIAPKGLWNKVTAAVLGPFWSRFKPQATPAQEYSTLQTVVNTRTDPMYVDRFVSAENEAILALTIGAGKGHAKASQNAQPFLDAHFDRMGSLA